MRRFPISVSVAILSTALLAATSARGQGGGGRAIMRGRILHANSRHFVLALRYHGDQDKPFPALILSVPERADDEEPAARITEDDAHRLIDHLARVGLLDEMVPIDSLKPPDPPACILSVHAQSAADVAGSLGWGPAMLKTLDALREAMEGDSATAMDRFLERFSSFRKEWDEASPAP